MRWLLPRVGALPVHHSRMDTPGMARIRRAITDGPYPVALAPKGQVSYSSATIPRLEAGTMRLALEAARTLAAGGTGGGTDAGAGSSTSEEGEDRIYIGPTPHGSTPERMTPLARALADRWAGEAWYAMRHMELADFAWYFHTTPPIPEALLEERAEYVQNL